MTAVLVSADLKEQMRAEGKGRQEEKRELTCEGVSRNEYLVGRKVSRPLKRRKCHWATMESMGRQGGTLISNGFIREGSEG